MSKSSNMTLVLGVLVVLAFVLGLWQLFAIRFSEGDVYPPYSSLRADPLGSRALYEGLDSVGGLRVGRLFEPVREIKELNGTTLFWLGDRYNQRPEAEWRDFVYGGGRLVVGWTPSQFVERSVTNGPGVFPWQRQRNQPASLNPDPPLSQDPKDVAFRDEWGVDVKFLKLPGMDAEFRSEPAALVAELPLPEEIEWHSTVCFTNLNSDWKTIYERQSRPVVIERSFGSGSVVIATDSWPFSNEALRNDRKTGFLVWLVGSSSRVVFDERHLGVETTQGVAGLMRRYRLHALMGGLFVVVVLYLWRSMTSFLPRTRMGVEGYDTVIEGHDLSTGFIRLLHRGIRRREVLKTCFKEWKESQAAGRTCSEERLIQMEQAMMNFDQKTMNNEEIVSGYKRLHDIWKEKKL